MFEAGETAHPGNLVDWAAGRRGIAGIASAIASEAAALFDAQTLGRHALGRLPADS